MLKTERDRTMCRRESADRLPVGNESEREEREIGEEKGDRSKGVISRSFATKFIFVATSLW